VPEGFKEPPEGYHWRTNKDGKREMVVNPIQRDKRGKTLRGDTAR
jgi:hypothetical protein